MGRCAICSMRGITFGELLLKLSMPMTRQPFSSRQTQVCEPIYPLAPVTSTLRSAIRLGQKRYTRGGERFEAIFFQRE